MAHAKKTEPRWETMLKQSTERYEQEIAKAREEVLRNRATTEALAEEHTNKHRDLVNAYNELARGIESLVKGLREEIESRIEIAQGAVRKDTQTALRTVALVRQGKPAKKGKNKRAN
jgi:hypothetical protein